MDYRTKPISRKKIRVIAIFVKKELFKCKNKYYFDVIKALEKIPFLFGNICYEIVDDNCEELKNVPAATIPDIDGNYCIKIKESVYEKAYFEKNGGCRMHIMHEICHVLLFMLGYVPYFGRAYKNYELEPFESIEWQAKALAGEILIPYYSTKHLDLNQLINKCKISEEAAQNAIKIREKEEIMKKIKK